MSSTLSIWDIRKAIDKLKMERYCDGTRKNYYAIWKVSNKFFLRLDIKPDNWEDRLVLFAGFLAKENKRASTIKCYISVIKAILQVDGFRIHEDRFLLSSITRACTYKNDYPRTHLPITKHLLKTILKETNKMYDEQPYLRILYLTLFSTAYFSLFRVGEITAGSHPIKAKDVHIGLNKKKLMIILWTSKTHWTDSKPQIVRINSTDSKNKVSGTVCTREMKDHPHFCPFELLKEFSTMRKSFKSPDEPFFIFRDRTPVTSKQFNKTLHLILSKSGFQAHMYTGTGFRAGRASDLLDMGPTVETIKKLGRWKSNAIYRYFH